MSPISSNAQKGAVDFSSVVQTVEDIDPSATVVASLHSSVPPCLSNESFRRKGAGDRPIGYTVWLAIADRTVINPMPSNIIWLSPLRKPRMIMRIPTTCVFFPLKKFQVDVIMVIFYYLIIILLRPVDFIKFSPCESLDDSTLEWNQIA